MTRDAWLWIGGRNVVALRRPAANAPTVPVLVAEGPKARDTSWRDLVRRLAKRLATP